MTRRSFYLPAATADALAQAANDLHYASHGAILKHVVLDAVIRAGLAHLPDLAQQLQAQAQP